MNGHCELLCFKCPQVRGPQPLGRGPYRAAEHQPAGRGDFEMKPTKINKNKTIYPYYPYYILLTYDVQAHL